MGVVSWATGDGVLKRSGSDTEESHQDGAGPSKSLNYAASVSRARTEYERATCRVIQAQGRLNFGSARDAFGYTCPRLKRNRSHKRFLTWRVYLPSRCLKISQL